MADDKRSQRLASFLTDLLRFGCIRGFKYFSAHMRGREEMIVQVVNKPQSISPIHSPSNSFNAGQFPELPRNQNSLMISARTQRKLSGYGYINVGLPPASPTEREIMSADEYTTVFLLAGYARYNCPYVWVRTNHDRLVRMDEARAQRDNPLKLRSTTAWVSEDIRVWDMVAELVDICTIPAPMNPFAVELAYFETLPLLESLGATSAMLLLLQTVLDGHMHRYDSQVRQDIEQLTILHIKAVGELHGMLRREAEPPRPLLSVVAVDDDAYVLPE